MKCKECGTELELGSVICPNCGSEIQIVPDFNIYEDEMFQTVKEEEIKEQEERIERRRKAAQEAKNHKRKKMLIIICILAMVIIIVGIVVAVSISNKKKNENSYDFQMQSANSAFSSGNYNECLSYAKNALALDGNSLDARFLMSDAYLSMGDSQGAIDALYDVLVVDPCNKEAFGQILSIYDQNNDYESIYELAKTTEEEELASLITAYLVPAPVLTLPGGSYDDLVIVAFKYEEGLDLYYTLDGSAPSDSNGYLYENEDIELTEDTTIRAICYSQDGRYSLPVNETYYVDYMENIDPIVVPESGTYTETMLVTIEVPQDGVAYYTTDGSQPSALTTQYTEPFEMPEGNHVLQVLVIKNRRASNVVSRSYIYTPLDKE